MKIRRYSELKTLSSFAERYDYLKLVGRVGMDTFGKDRQLNQYFYRSPEWRQLRERILVRDKGFDLGVQDFVIYDKAIIHHMNPIAVEDLINFNSEIMNPEFLITTSIPTHLAIHYGDRKQLPRLPTTRRFGDTRLW